jgi:[acyl-carrier-protein] S-malonyltransferase
MTLKRILAVFPGQGAQHVGMAKELLEQFKIASEAFEEASDHCHLPLRKLCLEGPDAELQKTEFTQPCLLTASVAAFWVARKELDFKPSLVAGHSLGEYSALVAAGALSLGQAAAWVHRRGQAMQEAVPLGEGSMAAILGLSDGQISKLCQAATQAATQLRADPSRETQLSVPAIVEPANDNAPGQMVIAGSTDAIEAAIQLVKTDPEFKGGKAIPLKVSAPFHCSLMKPARQVMEGIFRSMPKVPLQLACPYLPNRTGRETQEPTVILDFLAEQVDHPVLWRPSMERALDLGYTQGVEFGPGKVLAGLQKRIAQPRSIEFTMKNFGDYTTFKELESWLK